MALRARRTPRLRCLAGSRAGTALGLVALYGTAAVVSAWPGLGAFRSDYLAGGEPGFGEAAVGDHGQVVYRLWLLGHQIAHAAAPWRDPYSFQPLVEPQVALAGWPFGLPFWPLEAGLGPVVAWNVLQLAVVVIAGLATYAWLRALGVRTLAAALGGLAFALAPYRLSQSADHVLGWISVFLPLALLGIERARLASSPRTADAWGALTAVSLLTFVLSGQLHLAIGGLALALAYVVLHPPRRALWWTLGGGAAAVAVGIVLRMTVIAGSELGTRRSLAAVASYSAEPTDFLDRWHWAPSEELVYLGWLTPLLALAGFVLLARRDGRLAALLGLAALIPIVLAFGTHVPLYGPLREVVPPLQNARVPERLMPVADLALAALAAFAAALAADVLTRRHPGRRGNSLSLGCLVLLVGADLMIMPWAATPGDEDNAAYAVLATSRPARILELPLFEPGRNEGAVYNLYTLQTPRERPSGYSTLAPEPPFAFYWRFGRISCGVWLPGDEVELRRLGVRRLLFHAGLYRARVAGGWFGWRALEARGWRETARGGTVSLFERTNGERRRPPFGEPAHEMPFFCRGWSRVRRTVEPVAPLWIYGAGELTMDFTSARTTSAWVWADGRLEQTFMVDRRATVRLDLDGRRWHPIVVGVPGLFDLGMPYSLRMRRITFPWQ